VPMIMKDSMSGRRLTRLSLVVSSVVAICVTASWATDVSIANSQLSLAVNTQDGSNSITASGGSHPVIRSVVGAQLDHHWVKSSDYPKHEISQGEFQDVLGHGHQITVVSTGLVQSPDLIYIVRLYDTLPFGDIQVTIHNTTSSTFNVQSIRTEAVGNRPLDIGGTEKMYRVLSDSFSENWPDMHIYDLGAAPKGIHRATGSQLVYSRESKQSVFFGALTADRFVTMIHLRTEKTATGPRITSYTIDSTGASEMQSSEEHKGDDPEFNGGEELSLPLAPGGKMSSERVMFAVGRDYYAQLEAYAAAIQQLHHARVNADNLIGWWSANCYYQGVTEGTMLTNARWLAQHLKPLGYDYFHIDWGYEYARGEYTTPDATKFPNGMWKVASEVRGLGLRFAIWTAPFEVGERSWVYEHHQDWLVHDSRGRPIQIDSRQESDDQEATFVLDTTHPEAQQYLRQTYRIMAREWGVRYIKLDFMDGTAVEGTYHRPHTTALEALRIGLEIIREAVGEDVLLDKDGSPMLTPVGLVDTGRISLDMSHNFSQIKESASGIFARYYMHRTFFVNDPDAFALSTELTKEDVAEGGNRPLTLRQAQVSIVLAAMSGGMFQIGDDLPTLASDPDRFALVTNPDLLALAKLGRASKPLDLMTYRPEDEMPSIMFLRQDKRQSMLAFFNWTEKPTSHVVTLSDLKFTPGSYELHDVLNANRPMPMDGDAIVLQDQPPYSVRLIKIIDQSTPPSAPTIMTSVVTTTKVGQEVKFIASTAVDTTPAIAYRWDFGDGVSADGAGLSHTYTFAGTYEAKLTVDGLDGLTAEKTFPIRIDGRLETGPGADQPLEPRRRYVEP
jgi:alpha-galactosidase